MSNHVTDSTSDRRSTHAESASEHDASRVERSELAGGEPGTVRGPVATTGAGPSPLHRLLDRLLGAAEEINGAHRCPTYLWRWVVCSLGPWKVYIHRFTGNDWTTDLHDHPKRFVSVGLWGSYLEETPAGFRRYRAPWLRSFPATHRHRLTTPYGECWTLVVVLRTVREWGFWHRGSFVPWRAFVSEHGGAADETRDCR